MKALQAQTIVVELVKSSHKAEHLEHPFTHRVHALAGAAQQGKKIERWNSIYDLCTFHSASHRRRGDSIIQSIVGTELFEHEEIIDFFFISLRCYLLARLCVQLTLTDMWGGRRAPDVTRREQPYPCESINDHETSNQTTEKLSSVDGINYKSNEFTCSSARN